MKKILIDLNVIIDMINKREDHEAAVTVFDRCVRKHDRGYVCAHEITTLAYFLGKDKKLLEKRSVIVRSLLKTLRTIPVTETLLLGALDSPIDDYEDAVVEVSALREGIDYIVSRDLRDFKRSRVPSLTASDYIAGIGIEFDD